MTIALALGTAGCRVCAGACAKTHGRVVAGVVPQADGSLTVTSCELTTKGSDSTLAACRDVVVPPARGTTR